MQYERLKMHLVWNSQKGERLECLHTLKDPLHCELLHGLPFDYTTFKNISHLCKDHKKEVFDLVEYSGYH